MFVEELPNNELSLVHHVLEQAYYNSLNVLKASDLETSGFNHSKVSLAVNEYIMNLGVYAEFWDQAMLILAKPNNVLSSLEMLKGFSEDIYREASGNHSVSDLPIGM